MCNFIYYLFLSPEELLRIILCSLCIKVDYILFATMYFMFCSACTLLLQIVLSSMQFFFYNIHNEIWNYEEE